MLKLCANNAFRFQAKPIAIELERPLQVINSNSDKSDSRLHARTPCEASGRRTIRCQVRCHAGTGLHWAPAAPPLPCFPIPASGPVTCYSGTLPDGLAWTGMGWHGSYAESTPAATPARGTSEEAWSGLWGRARRATSLPPVYGDRSAADTMPARGQRAGWRSAHARRRSPGRGARRACPATGTACQYTCARLGRSL